MSKAPALSFRPVTRSLWADLEKLFSSPGGPKYCWCMIWRATPEEGRGTTGPVRKAQMRTRVAKNVPVGLIGYDSDEPAAWVSIAPRPTYRRLGGPPDEPGDVVWSLACMFVRRALRGRGLAHQLIDAAVAHARSRGATTVEAYPVAPDAPSYRFMGFVPAFEAAGFAFVEMAGTRRHVMRKQLD
ncbi:MAG: GNAT family N-acetyltransferase [Cucumibacter sp.]